MAWQPWEAVSSPQLGVLKRSDTAEESLGGGAEIELDDPRGHEIICSTNLIILLEDEIFADFFNTFLSLPVFGQTPFYTVENAQWSLWPEIPHDLIPKYKGLLTWLGKYRLPFFCKTNLCFHYILCQELISFINSPEGAKMMRWKKADQWLLQKCIGGVRGMWRFCTYLKGSAGEELVDFWILAEKILGIDEMDLELRDHYLSLLLMLKATHLQEGSRVVTLCNMNIKSLLNLSIWHPNQSTTRREILSNMQKVALFKLQSYWLPNFHIHAKTIIAKEDSCQHLMQEYETRQCSLCCSHLGELPLNMSIKKSCHPQRWYSSRKIKRKMWQLIDHASWSLELDTKPGDNSVSSQKISLQEKVVVHMPSLKMASSKEGITSSLGKDGLSAKKSNMKKKAKSHLHMEGLFETKISTHLRMATPIIRHSPRLTIKGAIKKRLSLGCTHWALCADAFAGSPFRDHLKKLNLKMEIQLLDLWQDLHHFLNVLMNNRKTGNATFWHILGNRICELYLNEQIGPRLPLKSQTIEGLKELLPSGNMNPWIPKAQEEICQMLSSWYDEFLNEEDSLFLTYATQANVNHTRKHKKDSISKQENMLLYKRLEESLALSQGLANMEEMDSAQWRKLATEDLRHDGSLRVELKSPVFLTDIEKMSFEELCYKYPKVAIEKISEDYKIYCEKAPTSKTDYRYKVYRQVITREPKTLSPPHKEASVKKIPAVRKPSHGPRNLAEIFRNVQHLEYFTEFLKERKAEGPLQFLMALQKISIETDQQVSRSLVENIMETYFSGIVPAEEMLQCDDPIIREVSQKGRLSTNSLLILQSCVMKSLEERWFKEYQELFPDFPQEVQTQILTVYRKPSKSSSTQIQEPQKRIWPKLVSFVKSFCKYRRCMNNVNLRQEFEKYLHLELNNKENYPASPNVPARPSPHHSNVRSADENGDIILMKRRIFGHRVITVNFALSDLYFFSEMERFNDLVSSAHVLQVSWAYNENDVILMKSKINIILKLYLQSEVPPRLRVNITETQRDAIISAIAEGRLDRNIFHGAIVSLFPVIMYFWKSWLLTWPVVHHGPSPHLHIVNGNTLGEHAILRFSLLRGIEWLRPQQRDAIASSVQNSSSTSNLTQTGHTVSSMQLFPVLGKKPSGIKKEKK
ncbi:PREDICTED: regulator of G-protein signaling protein-like [Myotis davidii]|uniref:regulator of G-protein signaling protein-like n=1 Tax=Myotis davidii TaxID=225400 RepID=UPI000767C246|nr:PREDICTED: regulator of G-protein signaling protein-like [Myotis davidii]